MVEMWVCILNRKIEFEQKDYFPSSTFLEMGWEKKRASQIHLLVALHTYIGRREDLAEL